MNFFNEIPWSNIASAITTLTLMTALLGPRFKFVRNFIGASLQDMLGITAQTAEITALRTDQAGMHSSNQGRFTALEAQITEVTRVAKDVADKADAHFHDAELHYRETKEHPGR